MEYYNSFFKARLSLLEEQASSRVLTLDLNPPTIAILDFGIPMNSESILINSMFDAPLCGIAATFTNKTPNSKLKTSDFFDLGLTDTKILKFKRYRQAEPKI